MTEQQDDDPFAALRADDGDAAEPVPSRKAARRAQAEAEPAGDADLRRPRRKKRSIGSRVVGVFGELLITAGVLVLLFLGWQFSLNGIMLNNQQASDANDLAAGWATSAPSATPVPSVTPTDPAALAPSWPYGEPPVMGAVENTESFAVMYVPRFGADFKKTIAEGVDPRAVLNNGGAGHYSNSQMPGEVGNFAIAAHRDGWGSPFLKINELQLGDKVYIETQDGWYTYTYRSSEYVTPFGVGVIDPVPQVPDATPVDRLITLTSCNPLYIASERIIAYGVLTDWTPRSVGAPAEIAAIVGA
ncbi:class E sortase [Herbiconiux sp. CPCC 203407]|uniref:Class E sortase n=1 Tax=Herbiconiux oxytropis TaxID=2970915 RepID=A0AA42BVY4_9MICO|nr:class E sortase [Herbiconiux oxytropis]MCS5723202.1 class E sortase [Herbiconiux oxytropis]MCS5725123.1 class E sortase [Herbiconiux oxytropis]